VKKPKRGKKDTTESPFCSFFGKDSGWVGDQISDAGLGEYLAPVRILFLPSPRLRFSIMSPFHLLRSCPKVIFLSCPWSILDDVTILPSEKHVFLSFSPARIPGDVPFCAFPGQVRMTSRGSFDQTLDHFLGRQSRLLEPLEGECGLLASFWEPPGFCSRYEENAVTLA
jgi:hypothetical protein